MGRWPEYTAQGLQGGKGKPTCGCSATIRACPPPSTATILVTKNNRVRKVPITPALRRALLARAHPSGYVFGRDPDGVPPRGEVASVQFCRLAHRLGFEDVSHHTLRHTGASVMLASGASLRAVQEIGGWTSLRMLERYASVSET